MSNQPNRAQDARITAMLGITIRMFGSEDYTEDQEVEERGGCTG
jgi:predicted SpoU family rRNA methylase